MRDLPPLLLLTLLVLGSYAPVLLRGGFVSDDFPWIAYVRDAAARGENFLRTSFSNTFRPAMAFSLQTDWRLWKLQPVGFLATNTVLHLCMVATVYHVGRLSHASEPRGPALLGAALFAVHPRHSEAVAWVAGRADLLYSLPYLWGLVAFLRSHERDSRGLWLVALGCLALALLGKESAVTFPLLLTLIALQVQVIPGQAGPTGVKLRSVVPFWALLGVYLGYRRLVLGEWVGVYGASVHLSADPWLIAENLARFLVAMVWPGNVPLAPFRMFLLEHPIALLTLALALVVCIVLLLRSGPWSAITTWLVGFFVTALPAWPLTVSLADVRGERFLYLPSVWACLAAGILMYKVTAVTHVRLAPVLRGVPILLLGLLTFTLSERWVQSGALAGRFASDLRTQTTGLNCDRDIYILTVPRFLGPTFVLYDQPKIDGLRALYGDPSCLPRIRGMTFQELARADDSLLDMRADSAGLSVHVPLRPSTLINLDAVADLGILPVPDPDRRWDWIFHVPHGLPRETLFAFTAGRLVQIW